MSMSAEQVAKTLRDITAWRADPRAQVGCPACGTLGLNIIDRSARPHVEWYALSCGSCGLDETLHIALGSSPPASTGT